MDSLPAAPEPGAPCPQLGGLPWLEAMRETPQNPNYHGEGDVLAHTQLVAEGLTRDPEWQRLDPSTREELWLAALLHDVGKPATTQPDLSAPGHARKGAILARRILWEAGVDPHARERICGLVKHHMAPYRLIDRSERHAPRDRDLARDHAVPPVPAHPSRRVRPDRQGRRAAGHQRRAVQGVRRGARVPAQPVSRSLPTTPASRTSRTPTATPPTPPTTTPAATSSCSPASPAPARTSGSPTTARTAR